MGGNDLVGIMRTPSVGTVVNSAQLTVGQVNQLIKAGAGTVIVPTVPNNIGALPLLITSVISKALPAPIQNEAIHAAHVVLNGAVTPDVATRQQVIHQAMAAAAAQTGANATQQQVITEQLMAAYTSVSAQANQQVNQYNQLTDQLMAQNGGNIVRADINQLFTEIIANPGQYGFANTVGTSCPVNFSADQCTSTMPGFDNSQAHLFADSLHPTPQTHALMADYLQAILDGPAQVTALNQATAAMTRDMRTTLDSRFQQLRSTTRALESWGVFGGYTGQHYNYSAGKGNATTHNLTVGVDYQLTDKWSVGSLIAGSDDKHKPSNQYNYQSNGLLFSAFTAINVPNHIWMNADLHFLRMNYNDIKRSVILGPFTRTENGNTNGSQWGARITAGWDIPVTTNISTGPVTQYTLDYSRVDSYSENANDSTAMRFNDQVYHSKIGGLGWRLDGNFEVIKPYAQIDYQHRFGDNKYWASGGLKSSQTSFRRDTATQDTNWVKFTLGANIPLSANAVLFATLSQTSGLSSGQQFMYSVGGSLNF